ncbi:hypothetical protein H0H81_011621 [Sphagnurus paluster]|uniref:Ricin B lectin domain-containing protein n=1 Tax=Sphagnurus paluster TaxID=117069 RepID=A0A9P7GP73_9AGAR|nr:hypothetical protein H0H81_011621 [Sphagnurus paluster]
MPDTYLIRNVLGDTVMDLKQGLVANQTPITGWHANGGKNQLWVIRKARDGHNYKIQNLESGTFVDLFNGQVVLEPPLCRLD